MTRKKHERSKDIKGASQLSVDAINGITDIVESLHATILRLGRKPENPEDHRTKGISGLVYQSIRTITKKVGTGSDVLLDRLGHLLGEKPFSPNREAALAALNGVLGDYLETNNNPLAIPIQFRLDGVVLSDQDIVRAVQQSDGKLLILIHGLCMNDLQWNRREHDHGIALAKEFGFTTIYLHYNSGRHVSQNGQDLSNMLERIVKLVSGELKIDILAHSMGGLVARSACYFAEKSGYDWVNHLQKLVFLGTPHHGALLEKGGNWIDTLLAGNSYSAPFSKLGKIRSGGITDMRYGYITEDDWKDRDRFDYKQNKKVKVPLPENVKCFAIAATTSDSSNIINEEVVGDGLVTVSSALGHHRDPEWILNIPGENQWIGRKMSHLDLLNDERVYEKLQSWLRDS